MSKVGKRTKSNWSIGAHSVNAYKKRVADPAVTRKRRNSKEIRRVLAQALNRVKQEGKEVYLSAGNYKGRPKPKTLYRVELFKERYYILCAQHQVISLFTSEMITGDSEKGHLIFRNEDPFDELAALFGNRSADDRLSNQKVNRNYA